MDARKAFPSVFKAGLLYKLHQIGIRGRYWRMIKSMYQHITTRILTGKADSDLDPEEIEALYYDVNTGVREGSTLSPLLYILFIDGLLDELRKRLGVHLTTDLNPHTHLNQLPRCCGARGPLSW